MQIKHNVDEPTLAARGLRKREAIRLSRIKKNERELVQRKKEREKIQIHSSCHTGRELLPLLSRLSLFSLQMDPFHHCEHFIHK